MSHFNKCQTPKHMFKKAREHGAEAVDPGSGPSGSQGAGARSAFVGSGFTLGSTGKFF